MNRLIAKLLLSALSVAGCAQHDARPAFRSSLRIFDRGISIPLPPPSVLAEPNVEVDIEGEIVGDEPVGDGMVVKVEELTGGAEVSSSLDGGATTFSVSGLAVDLTDNCLEAWLEDPGDGAQSDHALYTASAIDDTTVVVMPGCE